MGGLNPRERTLVLLTGALVLLVAIYVLVLEPRYQRLDMLRSQVPALKEDLAWMKSQVVAHRELMARAGSQSTQRAPLLTVIETTADRSGLRQQISRMAPAEEGRVRVWFDDVYFDPWLRWLESVRRQDVSVHSVNIVRDKENRVDVRLTVSG